MHNPCRRGPTRWRRWCPSPLRTFLHRHEPQDSCITLSQTQGVQWMAPLAPLPSAGCSRPSLACCTGGPADGDACTRTPRGHHDPDGIRFDSQRAPGLHAQHTHACQGTQVARHGARQVGLSCSASRPSPEPPAPLIPTPPALRPSPCFRLPLCLTAPSSSPVARVL